MARDSTAEAREWVRQDGILALIGAIVVGILAMPFGIQTLYTGVLGHNLNALLVGLVFGVGGTVLFATAVTILLYRLRVDGSTHTPDP